MIDKKSLLLGCCVLAALLIARCSTQVAGVETTNGCTVVASAAAIEGTVPPFSRVFVFDAGYIPYIDSGVGIGTAADEAGTFQFATAPGAYTVFVVGPTGEAAGIPIESPDSKNGTVSKNQVLHRPGAVSGIIAGAPSDTFLIFLAGMCQYQLAPAARTFYLAGVPEGTYTLKIARLSGASENPSLEFLHEQSVQVHQGDTAAVGWINF